ncbi:MAG TPA: transglutaminase family protein [Casimicrobiaceae bacterium]|nr:transglutaminase family protein [Casimicrobiaceae bacterium]
MPSSVLTVEHETVYRYAQPVHFLEHRLLYRPRSAHDFDVLASSLEISPKADVREIQDVFSNSVTLFTPRTSANRLRVVARFAIRWTGVRRVQQPIAPHAERYPFDYTAEERRDLGGRLEPHYSDPEGRLYEWTRALLRDDPRPPTRELLDRIAKRIRADFAYVSRDEEGTQSPDQTLQIKSGTCRDFALLMMEAVRRLGIAARYVSGYLYDPKLDRDDNKDGIADMQGAGSTHAWLHVYLPGAGWVPFDPTNPQAGAASHIRVAHARDPAQALPLQGNWYGAVEDYLGMDVRVTVSRVRSPEALAKLLPPILRPKERAAPRE